MSKQTRYWMVGNVLNGSSAGMPVKRHYTREEAEAEAQRLARLTLSTPFVVLETVSCFVAELPPATAVELAASENQSNTANLTA